MKLSDIRKAHRARKAEIASRLSDFEEAGRKLTEEGIFMELVFCLLTPQSRARAADEAVKKLKNLPAPWTLKDVRSALYGVRFPNNKSRFVLLARETFSSSGKISVRPLLPLSNPLLSREWLVKNVKGLGMKEASHFLRNIGYGKELAILDVHILRRLHSLGIIERFEQGLSPKRYQEYERRMIEFSRKHSIPLAELDLVLWSDGTGEVFK